MSEQPRIPVIIDTDVGDDIDDIWALAMALRLPQLDIRLVTTNTGDAAYRAKLLAKLFTAAGREDIPIAIGPRTDRADRPRVQEPWLCGDELDRYGGVVHDDAAAAIAEVVMQSPPPLTLIAIGPMTTVAAALAHEARIAPRCRLVGMHGCIRRSKYGSPRVHGEYNVVADIPACQAAFAAPWMSRTITPLDTCGQVRLDGDRYRRVRAAAANDPLLAALFENYALWLEARPDQGDIDTCSSCLFDTVAIHLAHTEALLSMQTLNIAVRDDGMTVVDDAAAPMRCAMDWLDLDAFRDHLVDVLSG